MIIKTVEKLQVNGIEEQAILNSALHSGNTFEYSCKNGQCGICKTTLLDGEVIELLPLRALLGEINRI